MRSSLGIASNIVSSTSIVRHCESPQTEEQRLLATFAPSHSSNGRPAIQMRFDSDGLALNVSWSISLIVRTGSILRGRSFAASFLTACLASWCVALQRPHVSPSVTSLCQMIGSLVLISVLLLQ